MIHVVNPALAGWNIHQVIFVAKGFEFYNRCGIVVGFVQGNLAVEGGEGEHQDEGCENSFHGF